MPSATAREITKPAAALRSRAPRRRSRSISSPASNSRKARPSMARTCSGRSTSTSPRTAGPITMPAAISRTTEGIRTEGTRPRASGTRKAIAATTTNPTREISGIISGTSRAFVAWIVGFLTHTSGSFFTTFAPVAEECGRYSECSVLAVAVHLDEHLDRALLLCQQSYHLLVVVETLHLMGKQALKPSRILRFCQGHVLHPPLEVGAVGVHRSHRHLVAQHEAQHDVVTRHLHRAIPTADAGQHQHAVLAQHLHTLEDYAAHARRLEDDVERAIFLRSFLKGHPARAHVPCP